MMERKLMVILFNFFSSVLNCLPVWSLGCVLFELITLRTPHDNIRDIGQEVLAGHRPSMRAYLVPEEDNKITVPLEMQENPLWKSLVEVFEACTEVDPEDRPSVEEVMDWIEHLEQKKPWQKKRLQKQAV